jgi:hypothetical protein
MDVSGQLHVPAALHLGIQPPVPTEYKAGEGPQSKTEWLKKILLLPLRGTKAGSLSSATHRPVSTVLSVLWHFACHYLLSLGTTWLISVVTFSLSQHTSTSNYFNYLDLPSPYTSSMGLLATRKVKKLTYEGLTEHFFMFMIPCILVILVL